MAALGRMTAQKLPVSLLTVSEFTEPVRSVNNVIFVGALALAGAFLMTYQLGAELLNFGAFIGFMGVNAAALLHYWVRSGEKKLTYLVPPLVGFAFCLWIWLNLRTPAKLAGLAWVVTGIIYGAIKTRGFRRNSVNFELPPE